MPRIRPAVPADRPAMEAVVHDAYAVYIPRIGRPPGPMGDDYAARIRDAQAHVLETDEGICGVLVLVPQPDALLLDNVAVRPQAQGRGYGRRLLAFAEQAARDAGHAVVRLYTHERMTENIALYARLGYVETHRVEEKGFRRVYMEKPLR